MNIKTIISLIALTSILLPMSAYGKSKRDEFKGLYENLPFKMNKVKRPTIPSRSVNIKDFGGVGNGKFLNTDAFRDAISALSSKGGGHLIVPEGIWFTGPILSLIHI